MGTGAFFNNDLTPFTDRSTSQARRGNSPIPRQCVQLAQPPHPGYDSNLTNLKLSYLVNYNSSNTTHFDTNNFGVMNSKTSAPYQRIINANVKYFTSKTPP